MILATRERMHPATPLERDEEIRSMAAGLALLDRMVKRGYLTPFHAEIRRARVLERAERWSMKGLVLIMRRQWS